MARGNGRQDIVEDDADRVRLVACLERAVRRSGWSLYAFVRLTNHLHLVLKTPRPNLAKGMQLFLSSYANGWARRHRHCGHLFQGHYRTELVPRSQGVTLEPRDRPHSGARAASKRTWLVTNKRGCNRAPWLDCSHFFNTSGEQTPDDIPLFRRSWALRCIIIPARAASTDSGGVPDQQGAVRPGDPVHWLSA